MNFTKIIGAIIVALTALAAVSAWSFTYNAVGPTPFSGTGTATYADSYGGYNLAYNGGTTYGSYWGQNGGGSWGYQDGYGLTAFNMNTHGAYANVYQNTIGGYSGYVGLGSYVSGPYYQNSYYYGPSPISYVGNSLYN